MTHGKFQTILGKSPPSQKMHQPEYIAREISRSNAQRCADQWDGVPPSPKTMTQLDTPTPQ